MDSLDEHGYPTDSSLLKIEQWSENYFDLMNFVKSLWYLASWGWTQSEPTVDKLGRTSVDYKISTAGWSGNEDIIEALKNNSIFWSMFWVSSKRGGHYEFSVKDYNI